MIRTASAAIGATLLVNAEGAQCEAVVTELRAWPPAAERAAASAQP
jgi:hypothetical protein